MIRLRVTRDGITNTEYLDAVFGQANDTMKIRHTREGSYSIMYSEKNTTLELTHFYSTDPKVKGELLEKKNAVAKGLVVRQVKFFSHSTTQLLFLIFS